jgi:hypothetical protein
MSIIDLCTFPRLLCNTLVLMMITFVVTRQKQMKKIALIVIVAGLALVAFTGFAFFTREKVVDVGSLEITANKRHDLEWSPILGFATLTVGAGLYFASTRRASQ